MLYLLLCVLYPLFLHGMQPGEIPWDQLPKTVEPLAPHTEYYCQDELRNFPRLERCAAPNEEHLPDEDAYCLSKGLRNARNLSGDQLTHHLPTLFLYAATIGNTSALATLIDDGHVSVDQIIRHKDYNALGVTALYLAVEHEQEDAVALLIHRGANPDSGLLSTATGQWSPLHATATNSSTMIAWQLIIAGANPVSKKGVAYTPRQRAETKNNQALVSLLEQAEKDYHARQLLSAVDRNDITQLQQLLKCSSSGINNYIHITVDNPVQLTPLYHAVRLDNAQAVTLFLNYGAEVSNGSRIGTTIRNTPLHTAVIQRSYALVKKLVQAGADPETPNHEGVIPLLLAHNSNDRELIDLLSAKEQTPFKKCETQ